LLFNFNVSAKELQEIQKFPTAKKVFNIFMNNYKKEQCCIQYCFAYIQYNIFIEVFDINKDKKVTKDEFTKVTKRIFAEVDKNKDNVIDFKELEAYFIFFYNELFLPFKELVMIEKLEAGVSEKEDKRFDDENKSHIKTNAYIKPLQDAFDYFDDDKNGSLDYEEFAKFVTPIFAPFMLGFESFDTNKDGVVDEKDEWSRYTDSEECEICKYEKYDK